jgi:hypothetical protein
MEDRSLLRLADYIAPAKLSVLAGLPIVGGGA